MMSRAWQYWQWLMTVVGKIRMRRAMQTTTARDIFIGAFLGQAIGDALGLPGDGLAADQVQARYGRIDGYRAKLDQSGAEVAPAGQFSGNTELALCLTETLVTNNGLVDPEAAGFRFRQVSAGQYGHLLSATTREALEQAEASGDFQNGIGGDAGNEADPAVRVTPIALSHVLGPLNAELFVREVLRATAITHTHPEAVNGALAFAYALRLAARRETTPAMIIDDVLAFIDEDAVAKNLRRASALVRATGQPSFENEILRELGSSSRPTEAIPAALALYAIHGNDIRSLGLAAANLGGASSTVGALAGALVGASLGAEALPLDLIEGLEGRMYILMAAPALLRVAQLRAGLFLELHRS
jgi:ADP-ribosylglycohydrolase